MFHPLSGIQYIVLDPDKQILVCSLDAQAATSDLRERWRDRAAAIFSFRAGDDVLDVVRDLLANPQIRIVVFDGEGAGREVFDAFWKKTREFDLDGIAENHADAVRQFVDLYDGDCGMRGPLQPFWPTRLKYAQLREDKPDGT